MAVHSRSAAASASGTMTQRTQLMLDLVIDIKNNRKRSKADAKAAFNEPAVTAEGALGPAAKAWLRSADVASVQLQGVSWETLIDANKKVRGFPQFSGLGM